MYSVLIVEDEMLVSTGLRNMINWAKLDMQVIAEAQNGMTALEIYQREKPDLILTDIKMPVMDGIQLISKIREKDKETKIIILTCYQEFDLVHQALKLGVSDYILKLKMSTYEMEKVIGKVHDELDAQNRDKQRKYMEVVDLKFYKAKISREFIVYQSCTICDFENMVCRTQMRIKPAGLILVLMRIISSNQGPFDEKHQKSIEDTIENMVEELFVKYKRGEIIYKEERHYLLIFSFADIKSEKESHTLLHEILDRVRVIIKKYINIDVVFGMSTRRDGYSTLNILYNEAASSMNLGFFADDSRYILFGNTTNKSTYIALVDGFRNTVEGMIELDNSYRKEITTGINLLEEMYCGPEDKIRELFIRWIHWPSANAGLSCGNTAGLALEYAGKVRDCMCFTGIVEVFCQYLAYFSQSCLNARKVGREVSEAIDYIRKNYNKDITLQQVAAKVEISSNYLCSLFGKELNISFVDYVNQVRVDRAKELLLSTHLKTYEVASQVGFSDESYFSRIFKRITGLRPNEFKRNSTANLEVDPANEYHR